MRFRVKEAPRSDLVAVFENVVGKGIRVEVEISDVRAGSEAWVTLSAAGVELLRIEDTVSMSPLQNSPSTLEPRRRGSRLPQPSSRGRRR